MLPTRLGRIVRVHAHTSEAARSPVLDHDFIGRVGIDSVRLEINLVRRDQPRPSIRHRENPHGRIQARIGPKSQKLSRDKT